MTDSRTYRTINLEKIDTSLSVFRLIRPGQISSMIRSLESLGQLQAVIVRECSVGYQLIDGFKRFYASEQLHNTHLSVQVTDINDASAKAMILNYNRASNTLLDYEESMVVYSLKHDHLLSQKEIAVLLGNSTSWVCRRLSLKERLEANVQSQLRLGKITSAHIRAIVKLPRGNQNAVTRSIIDNNVTSRQTAVLVALHLKSSSNKEWDYLLKCPVQAVEKSLQDKIIYDIRLGKHGNRLLRAIELLNLQQHIFTGQFTNDQTTRLSVLELNILRPKIKRLSEKSHALDKLINSNKTFIQ